MTAFRLIRKPLCQFESSPTDGSLGITVFTEQSLHLRRQQFNPLCPDDALRHHDTSLERDLIFLQLKGLEGEF